MAAAKDAAPNQATRAIRHQRLLRDVVATTLVREVILLNANLDELDLIIAGNFPLWDSLPLSMTLLISTR